MIEIYEITGKAAEDAAKGFGKTVSGMDRVFVMTEDGENIGLGVLGLEGGTVVIKEIFTQKPFEYFDLLARSVLSVIRDFEPIKVKVLQPDDYFTRFGFNENMEALSTDIALSGWCEGGGCSSCKKDCK